MVTVRHVSTLSSKKKLYTLEVLDAPHVRRSTRAS